jgi:hypothetical protein
MGRHKLIQSPDILWELFQQYKESIKRDPIKVHDFVGKDGVSVYREKDRPLTMEGFENYVADIDGMPMDLGHYFANSGGEYEEFCTICSRIKRAIRQDQIEGGMAGIYNPSITQRLNGLTDKSETKVIQEQPLFPD